MKKNILVFASTFPRWRSDPIAARFVYDLSKELSEYFNVHVLTPHTPEAQIYEEWDGLKIIRFPYFFPLKLQALVDGTGMLSCLKHNKLAAVQIPFFLICQTYALYRTVKTYKIDVVNSHWMIPQGFVAALLKPFLGFKHILTIHAAGLFALRRLPFGKQMAKVITKNTDSIYCVSSYNRKVLGDLVGKNVPSHVLPMGIHTEFYSAKMDQNTVRGELGLPSGKIVLYVGKLSDKKGVAYLIEAFHSIRNDVKDAFLVIVGGGALEDSLRKMTHNLEIENQVSFVGYQTKENIKKYYSACDVVAIPSIIDYKGETEGLPVVLLEALASGKPVVASRVGGMADVVIDGKNGYLVEQKDPEALARGIHLVFSKDDPEQWKQSAVESIQKFDWKTIGSDYKNTILNCF